MKRESLEDYEAEINQQLLDVRNRVMNSTPDPFNEIKSKFPKISSPIARQALGCSPYPQIPLFGSLVIPIYPVQKDFFSKAHNFDRADLERLIELHRDTGKVQFSLIGRPTQFEGLDYLDAIIELRTPIWPVFPIDAIVPVQTLTRWKAEFETAANIAYKDAFEYSQLGFGWGIGSVRTYYRSQQETYYWLRALGHQSIADEILDSMTVDPSKTFDMLRIYNQFLLRQQNSPLSDSNPQSLTYLQRRLTYDGKSRTGNQGFSLPCEVGSFLLKKLVPWPESFTTSMELMSRFDENGLQKVVQALSQAVADSDLEVINANTEAISQIFQNVWDDAIKLDRRISGVSRSFSTIIGIVSTGIGTYFGGPAFGTAVGILAAVGMNVSGKIEESVSDALSEKVLRYFSKDYTCTVMDFKQEKN